MPPPGKHTSATGSGCSGAMISTEISSAPSPGSVTPESTRNVSTRSVTRPPPSATPHPGEDRAGHARAAQHVLPFRDLFRRSATPLPHAFHHAVHAVDVGLADQSAVRVHRHRAADVDAAA